MANLNESELKNISFPDCEVISFKATNLELECWLNGIYLDHRGMIEAPTCLRFSNWKHLKIERFNARGENPISLSIEEAGILRDICECSLQMEEAFLAGFEHHSGQWQRYKFQSPQISVTITS